MKIIIIIPLILLASCSLFAQHKTVYNSDGTVGSVAPQATHDGITTQVDVAHSNPDGTPKSAHNTAQNYYSQDKVTIVNLNEVNDDGTPKGSVQISNTATPQIADAEVEKVNYRTKGNVDNPELAGKNEMMPRQSADRDLVGKNEITPRTNEASQAESQLRETQSNAGNSGSSEIQLPVVSDAKMSTTVIPETDRQLSDSELNAKYPARNEHNVQPVTGTSDGISDAEKQKQQQSKPVHPINKGTDKNDQISDALKSNKSRK